MIKIMQIDITKMHVDAIVNAANNTLMGGGGVDGAIHRAAGPKLLEYNRNLGGCETGQAKISPGFNLNAKWIIHTAGPIWSGGNNMECELLESCYRNVFSLALEYDVATIAFPSISTGIYGFPKKEAAGIALCIMKNYENQFEEIIACCFGAEDITIYQEQISGL